MNSGTAAAMPPMEGARGADPGEATDAPISYAQAQQLLSIYRAQGADALTPQQHNAIWDCLLAQPASQAVLEAMVEKAQAELQARMPGHGADGH
jgi:hypothetical protein